MTLRLNRGWSELRRRLSSKVAASPPSETVSEASAESLAAAYPIRLVFASDNERRSYFDGSNKSLPWYERLFLMPVRLQVANAAGVGFVNARLGNDPPFLPDTFCAGTQHALPRVFSALSGWPGDRTPGAPLSSMLTPTLLDRFAASHRALANAGLRIDFTWPSAGSRVDYDVDDGLVKVTPVRTWITFGPADLAVSTLLRGPVDVRYHNVLFKRQSAVSQQPFKIFREICFEYVYRRGSLSSDGDDPDGGATYDDDDDNVPDFNWKRRVMLQGQRIGIDAVVECSEPLKYSISSISDGRVLTSGSIDLDGFALRMESSHFTDDFDEDGSWKVADLDLCLTHPRVLEEEVDL